MTATLEESADRHRWTFDAHHVTRLSVEPSAMRIETWALEASAEVRIAAPFHYREPDGSERAIDPSEPERLAPLLGLLQCRLEWLEVARAGEITLRFGDGSELRCAPRWRGATCIAARAVSRRGPRAHSAPYFVPSTKRFPSGSWKIANVPQGSFFGGAVNVTPLEDIAFQVFSTSSVQNTTFWSVPTRFS
jgi:hypothetical protein